MSEPPQNYDSILGDDALAPLKRNHACLQCKKRKVKCDASKPSCSPCLRSHAHAVRAAQRNNAPIPPFSCTYTDQDTPERTPSPVHEESISLPRDSHPSGSDHQRRDGGERERKKGGVKKSVPGKMGSMNGKDKEKRMEDERDGLRAKIAELEARLAAVQTPSSSGSVRHDSHSQSGPSRPTTLDDYQLPSYPDMQEPHLQAGPGNFSHSGSFGKATLEAVPEPQAYAGATFDNTGAGNMELDWDIGGLFVVPAKWPPNLPSPFLLEHLVETFFNCVPQLPRMLHRGRLMSRIRLPPTNESFPHPCLLHAICAVASPHTAWVNSLSPEALERAIGKAASAGSSLEFTEDFGLSQAAAARRAMDSGAVACAFGSGEVVFEMVQASILLADLYFLKGMPMQGWLLAGNAPRLIKSLELGNRRHPDRAKDPMLKPTTNAIQREERLATVWLAHIQDAGFSMNSYWSQSMDYLELQCNLPTSHEEFKRKDASQIAENPQTAHTPNVLSEHPLPDTFILVVKASIIMSRVARWLREWHQRDIQDGDEMEGMKWPSYRELVSDIQAFQRSIPAATKNVFQILETPSVGFDADLLLVHVLPNIAFCLIQEPFVEWKNPSAQGVQHIQKSYEGVVGMLHLVPTNLDVSLIMTPVMAFSLYTVGRIIANFVQRALETQNYMLAVRYRSDLTMVQNLLSRYGQKHSLGNSMSQYLNVYLKAGAEKLDRKGNSVSMCHDMQDAQRLQIQSGVCPMASTGITQPGSFEALDPSQQIHNIINGIGQQSTPESELLQAQLEGMFTNVNNDSPPGDLYASGSSNSGCGSVITPGSGPNGTPNYGPVGLGQPSSEPATGAASRQPSVSGTSTMPEGLSTMVSGQATGQKGPWQEWPSDPPNPWANHGNALGPGPAGLAASVDPSIQPHTKSLDLDIDLTAIPFYDNSFNLGGGAQVPSEPQGQGGEFDWTSGATQAQGFAGPTQYQPATRPSSSSSNSNTPPIPSNGAYPASGSTLHTNMAATAAGQTRRHGPYDRWTELGFPPHLQGTVEGYGEHGTSLGRGEGAGVGVGVGVGVNVGVNLTQMWSTNSG